MGKFVKTSDFVGEFEVPMNTISEEKFEYYISRLEVKYLQELMGG